MNRMLLWWKFSMAEAIFLAFFSAPLYGVLQTQYTGGRYENSNHTITSG